MFVFAFTSCKFNNGAVPEDPDTNKSTMDAMEVAETFDYSTSKKATVSVNSSSSGKKANTEVKYTFYLYDDYFIKDLTFDIEEDDDVTENHGIKNSFINEKVASIITSTSSFDIDFEIPTYINKLYVVKNDAGNYSSQIIDLDDTSSKKSKQTVYFTASDEVSDMHYTVNTAGEVTAVNPTTGVQTLMAMMPNNEGSCAVAIDNSTRTLYTIARKSPNNVYKYDLNNNTWTKLGSGVGFYGMRLEFVKGSEGLGGETEDMLFFGRSSNLYKVSPITGEVVKSFNKITNLDSNNGGDLAYDDINKKLYMVTSTGLYPLTIDGDNVSAERLSATNPPMTYNSLTFDSDNLLWTNGKTGGGSRMGIMTPADGVASLDHSILADHKTRMDYIVYDLSTLRYDPSEVLSTDSDGDGTPDFYDDYPEDADVATVTYTPSLLGYGSYAFEDLWPSKGDYDFNDLVVNYRLKTMENTDGLVKKLVWEFKVKNIGGSFKNGFGIEFDFDKNLVESITGTSYTETGLINNDANGFESGQDKAVMMVFDNGIRQGTGKELTVTMTFIDPVSDNIIGDVPFNPFIFINGDRSREVHLPNNLPTTLVSDKFFGTYNDTSDPDNARYYKSENNLPWAIHVIHDFEIPTEKTPIVEAYNHFKDWAESGGTSYSGWYTDLSGYRNLSKLQID